MENKILEHGLVPANTGCFMDGQGSSELVESAGLNVQSRGPYRRKGQRSPSQFVLWCESSH